MTISKLRGLVAAMALAGAASAQAQVTLQCPPGAAAGDAATPLTMYTGADGVWEKRYGAGNWDAAITGNKHPNWYPGGGNAPANGSWLMPQTYPTPVTIPTTEPFDYRSPVITVDGQVDETSITVQIEQSTDNYYRATGIFHGNTEQGYVPYTGGNNFASLNGTFSPALTWAAGPNRLVLRTQNAEPTYGAPTSSPTGVYAIINITATCKAAPVPPPPPPPPVGTVQPVPVDNPWALLLAGVGLAAFGARRLRRRRDE